MTRWPNKGGGDKLSQTLATAHVGQVSSPDQPSEARRFCDAAFAQARPPAPLADHIVVGGAENVGVRRIIGSTSSIFHLQSAAKFLY